MKLAKLSLAAMVVAGLASSSFAESTTLADAFKNGKVNGELKAYYFNKDDGTSTENIFDTGVVLGYITDSLYGLSLGLTFQSNYAPFASEAAKKMYDGDMYGSGAVLSEAYIAYTIGKTTAKIGRQFIATPLVNGSGSRMIKEAFEGAVLVNTDLPGTTLFGGYAGKFQGRTSQVTGDYTSVVDGVSDIPGFEKSAVFYGAGKSAARDFEGALVAGEKARKTFPSNVLTFDGAYTMGAINKSINNLTLTGQYLFVNDVAATGDDSNVFYAEGNYVLPLSNMKVLFDLNYRGSRTTGILDVLNLEGDMYQGRIGFKELAGFGGSFAYSTVSSDDSVLLGAGNGPATYTAPLIKGAEATAGANTDAYKLEVTYDFATVGVTGLKVLGQYTKIDQDKAGGSEGIVFNGVDNQTKSTFWSGEVAYDIPALKGLTLSLQYEDAKVDDTAKTVNSNEMRFRANYKF